MLPSSPRQTSETMRKQTMDDVDREMKRSTEIANQWGKEGTKESNREGFVSS